MEIATEMFVVIASSSISQPARSEKDDFSARILGKMSSNHTVGRAFGRPRVEVLVEIRVTGSRSARAMR